MTAKEKTKNASGKVAGLVNEVAKLTVLELSELVTALQDKLGIEAAMPVAAVAAPTGEESGKSDETASGANQTVIMTDAGSTKIAVIKALREIDRNLGLKEAKDMTDEVPAEVLKDAKAEDAKKAAELLKGAGATVELK